MGDVFSLRKELVAWSESDSTKHKVFENRKMKQWPATFGRPLASAYTDQTSTARGADIKHGRGDAHQQKMLEQEIRTG